MATTVMVHSSNELTSLDGNEISILKLAEPILSQSDPSEHYDSNTLRNSDVSSTTAGDDGSKTTPASLEADLAHYKELFTKLRFSYVEQVTKEKFLRSVIGSPPLYVTSSENTALEAQLLSVKEQLQARKAEVADLVAELDGMSRALAGRWSVISEGREQMERLPGAIEVLAGEVERLRAGMEAQTGGEEMNLSLAETLDLVEQREKEEEALDREIAELEEANERKITQLRRLEAEVKPLQAQKVNVTAAANEARRRKEGAASGARDELEEKGRWLRGVEATMKGMLEVGG